MPSASFIARLYRRATTQRNVTIYAAILVGIPATSLFIRVGDASGSFLLLLTLAVLVPTAYDEYWPPYDRTWKAVGWILAACAVAWLEFTGVYLVGVEAATLSPLWASAVAFLAVGLGNLALLARWRR